MSSQLLHGCSVQLTRRSARQRLHQTYGIRNRNYDLIEKGGRNASGWANAPAQFGAVSRSGATTVSVSHIWACHEQFRTLILDSSTRSSTSNKHWPICGCGSKRNRKRCNGSWQHVPIWSTKSEQRQTRFSSIRRSAWACERHFPLHRA